MRMLLALNVVFLLAAPCRAQPVTRDFEPPPSDVFWQWVQEAARTPSFEVAWEVPTRLLNRDGTLRDEFMFNEHFVFHWPCCFVAKGRVVPFTDEPIDSQKEMRFNYDESIDATGRHLRASGGAGSFQERERRESMVPLLRSKMIDAPHLLGLFLAEAADATPAEWRDGDSVVAEIDAFKLRIVLARSARGISDGTDGTWGVQRLESLKDDGSVRSAWEYSDFTVPPGFHVAVGTRRQYVAPPDKPTPGPESEAKLVRVAVIEPPDSNVFVLDLGNATTTDQRTGEIRTTAGEVVGVDPTVRRGGVPWALVIGAVVTLGLLVVVGWWVLRAR